MECPKCGYENQQDREDCFRCRVIFAKIRQGFAPQVTERLRGKIEEAVLQTERGPIAVTASFGVSDALEHSDAKPGEQILSEFVSSADGAMYASKDAGRNRVTVFGTEEPRCSESVDYSFDASHG
jgi:GGDEF domain-containing protein